jgi:glycosyltransferase involved in cell wall biosynthesis
MDRTPKTGILPQDSPGEPACQEPAVGGKILKVTRRRPENTMLSFVIPAFNEEQLIERTIEAIHEFVPPLSYEVIVVDNGSTDATARIASDLGATVIHQCVGTIGFLRNRGVEAARGDVLVFLDADVVLTRAWADRIPASLDMLRKEPTALTGAMCGVPADASWLERCWFAPRQKASHIGSGHMVINRGFFQELGGFDESLSTGEDYDLSRRAVERQGRIVSDHNLRVEHLGFPRTVTAFIQRESWHGVGDYKSVAVFVRSKVAVAAAAFTFLHAALLAGLVADSLWVSAATAGTIVALCLLSSYRQYRSQSIKVILLNAGVFWIYYLGRSLAFFRKMLGLHNRGRR